VNPDSRGRPPRIALVSVGLGRVQRGFERYFSDVFEVVRDELDVTLFKSGGTRSAREKVPPLLRPATAVARVLPLGRLAGRTEYHRDCLAFGLVLLPALVRHRFDVIHCADPPMAVVLNHLKRVCRLRSRLLYTEGSAAPPQYYPPADHVHQVACMAYRAALAFGIPEAHMTLIPSGIHTQQFASAAGRGELRKKYAVPDGSFVVLSVSAINRAHKRIDYLIEEVSRLEGDILLWIDGNVEDPSLLDLARQRLGRRCRITHVPSSDVPELYRLADVMVLASLTESFGLAVVEAQCSGVPVLTHNSPHFEWLVGDRDSLLDMSVPGNLAARLRELVGRRQELAGPAQARAESVRRRFDWSSLKPAYLEMYRKLAPSSPPSSVRRPPS